ncbi:MAG TPA: class I SAM-dependent methyltransferase [Pilimelia sp.]|nr:class I SAM-dependent methyltransferase [Pilimelia sp.]
MTGPPGGTPAGVPAHEWGDAPDLYGPRHDYREALIMRRVRRWGPPRGAHALDAGAGAGSLALRLARHGHRVTAVDGSPAFVRRLQALLARAPGGPHAALTGDVGGLPVDDRVADLVVCAEVLEHLDDDAAAARELVRVMRPGALLVVTVPAGPRRFDWTDRWAGHRRRYTARGLRALLEDAGLEDVRVRAWGFPLSGLFHRHVYRPALRRRIDAGGAAAPGGAPHPLVRRAVRALLEFDTPFTGLFPGWMGLIATARRPGDGAAPRAR